MKLNLHRYLQRLTPCWVLLAVALWLGSFGQATAQGNDNCAQAVSVPVSASCSMPINGTVAGATQSLPPTANCGFTAMANDVWHSFVATGASQEITLAPRFAAIMDVRSGTCAASTSVFCATIFNGNTNPTVVGGLTSGQTYFIRIYASGAVPPAGIGSTFALCVAPGPSTTPPVNDDCAGAIDVPVQAGGVCMSQVEGSNVNATNSTGVPAPNCASYQGGDIWFKMTVPTSGNMVVRTVSPSSGVPIGDTGMSIYSGTCGALTQLGCDDDNGGGGFSLLTVSGRTPGEVLFIRVWTFGGNQTGSFAVCAVTVTPPANDNCAGAVTVPVTTTCNSPVNGTVAAASQSLPPTAGCGFGMTANDVWYSFVAGGATQAVTLTGNFQAVLDVRSGTCVTSTSVFCATNFGGQATTISGLTAGQTYFLRIYAAGNQPAPGFAAFGLCITPGPVPPANDECAGAVPLPVNPTCVTPTSGTVANASQSLAPTANCGGGTIANDVWYSFVASGATQTVTYAGDFGAIVDVRSGTCANSTSVFCANTFTGQPLTLGGLTSGQTYFLRVYVNGGFVPFDPTFTLCITPGPVPPANDECAGAIAIPVTPTCVTPTSGTVANASQSLAATSGCGGGATIANDVWYSFVASGATQTVTYTGNFGVLLDVRSGTCANSTSVFCTNAFAGQPLTVGGLTSGQTYFLRLYVNGGFVPFNPTFTLCITPGPVPPVNDDCAGAIAVPVTTNCATPTSGTYAATSQSVAPTTGCGFATIARDVWYSFVASGTTQTITVNSTFGTVLDVRSGTCASSTSVFCATTFTGQSAVATGLTSGQTYFLRLYPNTNAQPTAANGALTLCITAGPPPSANDECATAVPISVVQSCATSTNGTVANASQSLPPVAGCGTNVTTAADVWYSFVAATPTQLITLTSRFGAVIDVRSGTCANSTSVFCNTVFANSTAGTVVGGLTSGQTYYIRIYANGPNQPVPANATFTLCINPAPTPPANDECATAVAVPVTMTCTSLTSGSVESASQSLSPTATCGTAILAQDVWYSFVATGVTQLVSLNARFASVLDVRSGTCASSTSVFCTTIPANSINGTIVGGLTSGQTYYLRVYANGNIQPTPLNATFTLCINPGPTPPVNDECAAAIALPVTTACTPTTGTVAAASQSLAPTTGCGGTTANDVWYSFVATGVAHTITLAPQFVGALDVRTGTCLASTSLFCRLVGAGTSPLQQVGGLTVGQTYFIRIYSNAFTPPTGAGAAFTVCVAPAPTPPVNDECAGAINVPVQFGTTCVTSSTATNALATGSTNVPAPTCNAGYQGGDIWFTVTVPPSGVLNIRTVLAASNDVGDTGMSVYSGTCGSLSQIGCDDDGGGSLKSLVSLTGRTAGEILYIRVWRFNNNVVGNIAVCVTSPTTCPAPSAPATAAITASSAQLSWQPGSASPAGTTYSVEYGLQGFALGTGTVISGIANPMVQLTSLQPSTAYCYYIRQECPGTTGSSAYVGPTCFTTLAASTTCLAPTAPSASNVATTTAQLNWQPGGTPPAGTTYTIEYGAQGFTPGAGTTVSALTGSSTAISGLQPGTAYCFYVRQDCPGASGSSAFVGPTCFTTTALPTPCLAPTTPSAGTITTTTAQLSWQPGGTPAAGTTYTVEYGVQGFTPGTGTLLAGLTSASSSLTSLQPGTAYCFYVRQDCPGASGSSAFVGPTCFTTTALPTPCATPTGLASANITNNSADLSWLAGGTPAAGTTYTIEYGLQGFTLGSGTVITGLTSPSYPLQSLQPGTAYCFYVRQVCPGTSGSSAYVGPSCFTTTTTAPTCVAPTNLAVTSLTGTTADLSWTPGGTPAAGTTYTVVYGLQGFMIGNGTVVAGLSTPSTQLTGLQAGTTYCFYVRQDCPGATGSSSYAGPQCFTPTASPTTCFPPSGLTATNITAFAANLSWQPSTPLPSGTTFTIEYGLQGFTPGTGTTVAGLQNAAFALTALSPATGYCYYVRQDCPAPSSGSSAFVGPFCFQTLAVPAVPTNDDPCGAVTLALTQPGAPGQPVSGSNVGGTTSTQLGIGTPTCSPTTTPQDVWFEMTPPAGTSGLTLSLSGSAAGMVRVFTAPSCSAGPFTLVACQSSGASNTGLSTMTLANVTPGQRYFVVVSGYGTNDTPGTFTIAGSATLTATRAQAETNALVVYPNPSNTGQLTLRLHQASGSGEATLYNSLGQAVLTKHIAKGTTEQVLETRGLATGVYTLRVTTGGTVLTRKVMLE